MMRRTASALRPWGWQYHNTDNRRVLVPSRDDWYGREAGSEEETQIVHGEIDLPHLRAARDKDLSQMTEMMMARQFLEELEKGGCAAPAGFAAAMPAGMSNADVKLVLQAAYATSLLHVESRVASAMGLGFYTIGPGGEELIACVGAILNPDDGMALHYRHTAAQVARQLKAGRPLADILLDRARGHVVSAKDPVSGGHHCAIGGGPHDFLVTSTLASQAPQAVGRAIGQGLASQLKLPCLLKPGSVSFVSVGDGSVNHAQYLASLNLAEYAQHRRFKCPLVFGVSDNGIAISLKGYNWLQEEFVHKLRMEKFEADGRDMFDVWAKTASAVQYSRRNKRPSFMLYKNLPRRFGHAATDRQGAYLTPAEIKAAAAENPIGMASAQAVTAGAVEFAELAEMFQNTWAETKKAFDVAVNEPKVTERSAVQKVTEQPLWKDPAAQGRSNILAPPNAKNAEFKPKDKHVMRKHMTKVLDEILTDNPDVVYIGEDVEHGGYYLVTDQLAKKHQYRVADFPPEESCLMGLGIGYSQVGLVPIVEIPYAKYLDCGVDQYFEAAIMNWLSAGKQPCGMVVRLQGFDRGVFGGNFHTHNMLHLPPGIDVVCYSNGPEYAKGMRHAVEQARAGRIVMSVDCTNLLNNKNISNEAKDGAWEMPYSERGERLTFDDVTIYGNPKAKVAIVTYGNGVLTCLQAVNELAKAMPGVDIKVIDNPYVSGISWGLIQAFEGVEAVVFADICKFGQHPFGAHIGSLKFRNLLPNKWQVVAAQPTYNPLGTYLTFLNVEDVVETVKMVLE